MSPADANDLASAARADAAMPVRWVRVDATLQTGDAGGNYVGMIVERADGFQATTGRGVDLGAFATEAEAKAALSPADGPIPDVATALVAPGPTLSLDGDAEAPVAVPAALQTPAPDAGAGRIEVADR